MLSLLLKLSIYILFVLLGLVTLIISTLSFISELIIVIYIKLKKSGIEDIPQPRLWLYKEIIYYSAVESTPVIKALNAFTN